MTTYIVAVDYEEYWMPLAATSDEKLAEAIQTAASDHLYMRMQEKEKKLYDEGDQPTDARLDDLLEQARERIIIASTKPPFVAPGTLSVPQVVFDELDRQISEDDLLEMW